MDCKSTGTDKLGKNAEVIQIWWIFVILQTYSKTQNVMTKYPIGLQNFKKIREDGYLYIDKTALIHQLVVNGG